MRNKIISVAIFCSVIFNSHAETITSLKKLCNPGAEVTLAQDYFIEGIVISDWRSPNMDLNQSITVNRLNIYENDATAGMDFHAILEGFKQKQKGNKK